MKVLSNEEYQTNVKQQKGVVLVDFFATWCGPCRMLAPILEQASAETDANIYKIDVDECPEIAKEFGIMSVPTMIIFKDGEEKEKMIGLRQKTQILEAIKKYL